MEKEKDLVWLPISLAAKVKEADDVKAIEREILSYVESTKNSLQLDIESMDDSIIQYRACMIKAREAFKKAKDEELDAFTSLWETYDKDIKSVHSYVKEAKEVLKPLVLELQSTREEFSKIKTWEFEKLGEAIQKLATLYGTEKEMFTFLVQNFKSSDSQ